MSRRAKLGVVAVLLLFLSFLLLHYTALPGGVSFSPGFVLVFFVWLQYYPDTRHRRLYGLSRALLACFVIGFWTKLVVHAVCYFLQTILPLQLHVIGYSRYFWLSPYFHLFYFFISKPLSPRQPSLASILSPHPPSSSTSSSSSSSSSSGRSKVLPSLFSYPRSRLFRAFLTHTFIDFPLLSLIVFYKCVSHPLNSLCTPITPKICIGAIPLFQHEIAQLKEKQKIVAVVNMCAEFGGRVNEYERIGIAQLHLPVFDMSFPTTDDVEKAILFIRLHSQRGPVFVHCKFGMGRSATVVLCHLVVNESMSLSSALSLLKQQRPEVTMDVATSLVVKDVLERSQSRIQPQQQ